MWRQWGGSQGPAIGYPTLTETTMDERYLETIPEVESIRSGRSSIAAALPDLPFRAVPPLNEIHPAFRNPTASVYSPASPTALTHGEAKDTTARSSTDQPNISPVSTPRSSVDFAASDTSLVSPIETSFNILPRGAQPQDSQFRSQIPRPATVTTQDMPRSLTPPNARERKQNTKWNKYTGEQTTENTGLPSQAPKPGSPQSTEMQFPQFKERTRQILAGLRDKEASKRTPWGKPPLPVAAHPLDAPVQQKVPWKGASGRTAVVEPVQNTPAARTGPLQHPQGNVSGMDPAQDRARMQSPDKDFGNYDTQHVSHEAQPYADRDPAQVPEPLSASPAKSDHSIRRVASQESIKPVAPLKIKSPRVTSPVEAQNLASIQSPFPSPAPSQTIAAEPKITVPRLKDPPKPKYTLEKSSPPTTAESLVARKPVPENESHLGATHLQHEPESRLSWTTYATTVNDSPRTMTTAPWNSSPVPPMPPLSAPLVIKKRPVWTMNADTPYANIEANDSRASIISRKPVATGKDRSASLVSNSASKLLPPTPIELEAGDKISSLEARLEDLERRRCNNSKVTWQLKETLKKNAIVYDMRKRKEVENTLTSLGLELDEITREEHEVGLRLHRAQKKRDREDCYENPTGLWIKRVTS